MRILYLEDHPKLQALVAAQLIDRGHQVVTVRSSSEARQQLESHSFDGVICDGNVPQVQGGEVGPYGFELVEELLGRGNKVVLHTSDPELAAPGVPVVAKGRPGSVDAFLRILSG